MAQASSLFEDAEREGDLLDAVDGATRLVALRDGAPVGIAGSIAVGETLYLQYLAVRESERGRGVGRSLTAARLRAAPGCRRAVLDPAPDRDRVPPPARVRAAAGAARPRRTTSAAACRDSTSSRAAAAGVGPRLGGVGSVGLPRRGLPEPGALEHLQRQQRALQARGRDVDPEQLEDEGLVEAHELLDRHPDHLVGGHRGARLGDRAAVAGEADLLDAVLAVELELDLQLVAAERVEVLELEVRVFQLAPIMRLLVVIQDVLAVEVVHQPNTPRTEPSASIRRSTSSRVEWTAKLARDVAATPRRRISGCAQWWPARMQTPSRPMISETSCGCTPSRLNAMTLPR